MDLPSAISNAEVIPLSVAVPLSLERIYTLDTPFPLSFNPIINDGSCDSPVDEITAPCLVAALLSLNADLP